MTTFTKEDREAAEHEPIPFAGWVQHSDDTVTLKRVSVTKPVAYAGKIVEADFETNILKVEMLDKDYTVQAGTLFLSYAQPATEQWISTSERMPADGQNVAFVVKSDMHDWLDGRVLGGRYTTGLGGGFSVPGMHVLASHWMPLPDAPTGKAQ